MFEKCLKMKKVLLGYKEAEKSEKKYGNRNACGMPGGKKCFPICSCPRPYI